MGEESIHVLRGLDIAVKQGELLAIEGRSGEGKSTLLHLLGLLDEPDSGVISFEGKELTSFSGAARAKVRNEVFGFVFQFYHLLPELNVLENTLLAAMVRDSWLTFSRNRRSLHLRAKGILEELGLSHRLAHRPNQLSGGERQRVAIARALMNQPRILFADEPTGNLDAETGKQIMHLLEKLHAGGQTIIFVTHDKTLARTADRALVLRAGKLSAA
jgi:lipoprotein-releasing system ATP-binding protein